MCSIIKLQWYIQEDSKERAHSNILFAICRTLLTLDWSGSWRIRQQKSDKHKKVHPMLTSWIYYIFSLLELSILLCSSSNKRRLLAMIFSYLTDFAPVEPLIVHYIGSNCNYRQPNNQCRTRAWPVWAWHSTILHKMEDWDVQLHCMTGFDANSGFYDTGMMSLLP